MWLVAEIWDSVVLEMVQEPWITPEWVSMWKPEIN